MNFSIIYEDQDLLVINKPCGVVVNRAETVKEETVQDWMASKYPELWKDSEELSDDERYFVNRLGLVHRLDRETSGVMILAKSSRAFVELLRQFKEREIEKTYEALTHGLWKDKNGEIVATVGRMRHDRKKMGVREDGRPSVTNYEVIKEYRIWSFDKELKIDDRGYTGFSLVIFKPKTGRTHQIRVHAKHVGHPLVGDFVYSGRKRSRADRKWAGRIMLHAKMIKFRHPVSSEIMEFETENIDLKRCEQYLEASNEA